MKSKRYRWVYILYAWLFVYVCRYVYHRLRPSQSPLIEAIMAHDVRLVKRLLEHGSGGEDEYRDYTFVRPGLVLAAEQGDKDIVLCLLEKGENINVPDNYGFTPLSSAVLEGNRDMVQLLITHGADVNDDNPRALAIEYGYFEIARILEKAGAK